MPRAISATMTSRLTTPMSFSKGDHGFMRIDVFFVVQSPSHVWLFLHYELQHARLPYPSLSPGVCSNSYPLSQWCYLTISSFAALFSICLQSFPGSGSFPVTWLLASGGQSTGALASASVLPMNIQGWLSLGLTGLTSLQSKGLSRVFSSTTIQKHQFFRAQPSLGSNSHIHTWLQNHTGYTNLCQQSGISAF